MNQVEQYKVRDCANLSGSEPRWCGVRFNFKKVMLAPGWVLGSKDQVQVQKKNCKKKNQDQTQDEH